MCTVHWRGWSRATVCSVKSSPAAWHVCPFLKKHFKSFEVPWWERTGLPAWELSCLDPYLNVLSDSCSLFSQDTAGGIDTFERWCDKNTNKISSQTIPSWVENNWPLSQPPPLLSYLVWKIPVALKAWFKYEGKSEARSTEQTSPGKATSAKGVKNSVPLQTYLHWPRAPT